MNLCGLKVMQLGSAKLVCNYLVDALKRELVGPDPGHPFVQWSSSEPALNGEEVLRPQDPPRFRYACGILFPNGVRYSGSDGNVSKSEIDDVERFTEAIDVEEQTRPAESQEESEEEDERKEEEVERSSERDSDVDVDQTYTFLPSTMGLSFLVGGSGDVVVQAAWATYSPEEVQGYFGTDRTSTKARVWLRQPQIKTTVLRQKDLFGTGAIVLKRLLTVADRQPSLVLDVISRPWGDATSDRRLVTLTLMNTSPGSGDINENCFYQCSLRARTEAGLFIAQYPETDENRLDTEQLSLKLLYRDRPVFAVGHGCAADWRAGEGTGASEVRTEVMPVFEQAPIVPRLLDQQSDSKSSDQSVLSMRAMAEESRTDIIRRLRAVSNEYTAWIQLQLEAVQTDRELTESLRGAAIRNLSACEECLRRIEEGTAVLERDDQLLDAFRLMNKAMVEQRAHYALGSEDALRRSWLKSNAGQQPSRRFEKPEYPYTTQWRPFQLAFILMNLVALSDPSSAERDIVDIIWFPTGGGKTEAYLGLAALVILLRRMRRPDNTGTTILMRYTLRLLTTQQFQRAASLICALELIRRERSQILGDQPITIGLWLGSGVTPNRNEQAVQEWNKLANGEEENKFVVLSCPWCGVDMGPRDYGGSTRVFGYEKKTRPALVRFRCEDTECPFSSDLGLPLEVVDERIYASPPALIVGTVDKFAMLPWEPNARSIFGLAPLQTNDPPELIIQDELHLISGPLGSMVGHYETIIDALCSRVIGGRSLRAKIVASTATIARAEEQVRATFAREARLFPPQALRAGESFFAEERRDLPGRAYVGVFASALPSHVTAQVFATAALLQAPALLQPPALAQPIDERFRDPYWTLIAYFNSLRELGRAATLVQADIRERLNAVWDRIGLTLLMSDLGQPAKELRRFINRSEELTSRVRSSDVPSILQKLFASFPDAVDFCLATNMIQVGLDVPRLSLMTIVGQPKTTSEYIQASSRVGRATPGLVVTNLNPFKPRDRSHFETFRSFHESIYRHVEPTSVTPFSIPVCQRAIHALAIALVRCLQPDLADAPQRGLTRAARAQVEKTILDRVTIVAPEELNNVKSCLTTFLDTWDRVRPRSYGSFVQTTPPGIEPMMWPAGKARPDYSWQVARDTPSSMRNVDAECEALPLREYPGASGP